MSDLVKSVLLKIKADDGDVEAKLDRISEKADELGRKHPELSVRIKTAEATAKIAAIREELKAFGTETDKIKEKADSGGRGGLISRLLFGAAGDAEGGEGGGGGLAGLIPDNPAMLLGLVALIPVIEAAAAEATALASGLAAAGAGVGAFGLLALPAVDKVKAALKDTHAELAKLSPDERGAVLGIRGLKDEYLKMSKAFEPDAFKVFNQGLKIADKLLPDLKPFADIASGALGGLLGKLAKFAGSSGFKDWLAQFRKLEGPSITAIGSGLGRVGIALGNLLTLMSKKDVVHAINIAFRALTGTIDTISAGVSHMMQHWDSMTKMFSDDVIPAFDATRHEAAAFGDKVAQVAIQTGRGFHAIVTSLVQMAEDVGSGITKVVGYFQKLPGRVGSALSSLGSLLFRIGQNAILGLVHGIESMFGAVAGAVRRLAGMIPSALSHILSIFSPSRVTYWHGQMIGQGLIDGMDSMNGKVAAAAGRMGLAAGLGGRGGYGAGAAGGGGNIYITVQGFVGNEQQLGQELQRVLLNLKRHRGQKVDTSRGLGLA